MDVEEHGIYLRWIGKAVQHIVTACDLVPSVRNGKLQQALVDKHNDSLAVSHVTFNVAAFALAERKSV